MLTGDQHLGFGTAGVNFFDEGVSAFVGFNAGYSNGLSELCKLLPTCRKILYVTTWVITQPDGWQLNHAIQKP